MSKSNFFQKFKSFILSVIPELAIIVGGFVADIVSKYIVQSTMEIGDSKTLIPKLLNISYTLNENAAFGFDWGLGDSIGQKGVLTFFIIITFLSIGFFAFLLFKKPQKGILFRISFALIIAGAFGNLYDRIVFAYVRDFIEIEYLGLEIFGHTTFAIFNIADSCVVVGAIMLIIYFLFVDKSFFASDKKAESKESQENSNVDTNEAVKTEISEENSTEQFGQNDENIKTEETLSEQNAEQVPEDVNE